MILNKYFLENYSSAKSEMSSTKHCKQTIRNRYGKHPFPWVPLPATYVPLFAIWRSFVADIVARQRSVDRVKGNLPNAIIHCNRKTATPSAATTSS